jgi:hypothetical protein
MLRDQQIEFKMICKFESANVQTSNLQTNLEMREFACKFDLLGHPIASVLQFSCRDLASQYLSAHILMALAPSNAGNLFWKNRHYICKNCQPYSSRILMTLTPSKGKKLSSFS